MVKGELKAKQCNNNVTNRSISSITCSYDSNTHQLAGSAVFVVLRRYLWIQRYAKGNTICRPNLGSRNPKIYEQVHV
ncbi:hypothetical protein HN873_044203 [Arachis hypogaea]